MALAVYGKHPAKGDFLEYGLPAGLRARLETWLDAVLAEARADLGPLWEPRWREAPYLRFWLGEGVWGDPVCGVMVATQDRVGRRFPLVILASGAEATRRPPPPVDPDQGWYDRVANHLAAMLKRTDLPGPSALLDGLAGPALDETLPGPGSADFWAARPDGGVDALWADVALTDHRRASAGRSYWWIAGPAAAAKPAEPVPVEAFVLPGAEQLQAGDDDAPDVASAAGPDPLPTVADAAETGTDTETETETETETGDTPESAVAGETETSVEEGAEAAAQPESEPEPEPEPVTPSGEADPALWSLPDEMDDDSPFASPGGGGGLGLFARPAPALAPLAAAAPPAPVVTAMARPAPPVLPQRELWSQVWAGPGLPGGLVIAWFLRGFDGNG